MRKIVLLAALALFTATFCSAAPLACGLKSSQIASATLMAAIKAPVAEVPGQIPPPLEKTGCTASVQCPTSGGGSTTLSCNGNATCTVYEYQIECDGVLHSCGCVGTDLCRCDCLAGGGTGLQCFHECGF
jgi:hypothetical protein